MLILPVFYFGVSLASGINIGYRHLLPILPFLFIFVARIATCDRCGRTDLRIANCASRLTPHALLISYIIVTLTLFPWYLAYFNTFAGGPDGGYRYLVDSNLDWGQTWKALRRYLDERSIDEFGLSQYTINDPHAYGLDYTPLPPWPDAPPVLPRRFNPAPGVYAISTTTLQGVVVADSEMFDYFRKIDPVARVGHAMFVYQVEAHSRADWAAQCTTPVAPLSPEALAEGLGRDDLRLTGFDCSQSWLYPAGNGWYALSRDYEGWGLSHVRRGRTAYAQTRAGFAPPFTIYEWFDLAPLEGISPAPAHAAPGDWSPQRAEAEGMVLTPPVKVGDALEFLGYVVEDAIQRDQARAIQTYWRVSQTPLPSLSLMAHLLDENGAPLAVGDGLGIPTTQLRPGDVVVQRHILDVPPETAPGVYWLQVGAYTLPDVQRLPIIQNGATAGDRLLVGRIKIATP